MVWFGLFLLPFVHLAVEVGLLMLLDEFGVLLLPLLDDAFPCGLQVDPVLLLAGVDLPELQILLDFLHQFQHLHSLVAVGPHNGDALAQFVHVDLPHQSLLLDFRLRHFHLLGCFAHAHTAQLFGKLLMIVPCIS